MIDDRKSKKVSTVNMELWKPRGQAKLETYDTVQSLLWRTLTRYGLALAR